MVSEPGKQCYGTQMALELVRGKGDKEGQTYWIITETNRLGIVAFKVVYEA
jgi:hypothetical protein